MNISPTSKIYKLLKFFDDFFLTSVVIPVDSCGEWDLPNLCSVIRSITFGFLLCLFLIVTPFLWFWVLLYDPPVSFLTIYTVLSMCIASILFIILFLGVVVVPFVLTKIGTFLNYLTTKGSSQAPPVNKEPGIIKTFSQYCIDKHNKVCRTVTFDKEVDTK